MQFSRLRLLRLWWVQKMCVLNTKLEQFFRDAKVTCSKQLLFPSKEKESWADHLLFIRHYSITGQSVSTCAKISHHCWSLFDHQKLIEAKNDGAFYSLSVFEDISMDQESHQNLWFQAWAHLRPYVGNKPRQLLLEQNQSEFQAKRGELDSNGKKRGRKIDWIVENLMKSGRKKKKSRYSDFRTKMLKIRPRDHKNSAKKSCCIFRPVDLHVLQAHNFDVILNCFLMASMQCSAGLYFQNILRKKNGQHRLGCLMFHKINFPIKVAKPGETRHPGNVPNKWSFDFKSVSRSTGFACMSTCQETCKRWKKWSESNKFSSYYFSLELRDQVQSGKVHLWQQLQLPSHWQLPWGQQRRH